MITEVALSTGVISLNNLNKIYKMPAGEIKANDDISLDIYKGDFLAVVGQSGSGKTTLINLITGIDNPTSGTIQVNNTQVDSLSQRELSSWRGLNVGVVFQFFQLLPTLTVLENIILPMDLCNNYNPSERKGVALSLLDKVGIQDQADKFPAYLSGGQQQRAAIARALANDPDIICADEPTGNLDSHTSDRILGLFSELAEEGKTIMMVTHERDISSFVNRQITLVDGKIDSDRRID